MEMLVDKLIEEHDETIVPCNLDLIHVLLFGEDGCDQLLKTPGILRLADQLNHASAEIREKACLCLRGISYNEMGKAAIIKDNCVHRICAKLDDESLKVRVAVTGTLASLAQLKQGKVEIIEGHFFETIQRMLYE